MTFDMRAMPVAGRRVVFRTIAQICILTVAWAVAGCSSKAEKAQVQPEIQTAAKFLVKDYGVAASPRVVKRVNSNIRRGGGRYHVGKAYKIRGRWYKPKEQSNYSAVGLASWYGPNFHGRLTANGEIFDMHTLSAAHTTLPLPSYVRVTNLENKRSVVVRVNDRGPFAHKRVIDLSSRAADLLSIKKKGVAKVRLDYIGRARLDGQDVAWLEQTFRTNGDNRPLQVPPNGSQPETMLANIDGSSQPIGFARMENPAPRPILLNGMPIDEPDTSAAVGGKFDPDLNGSTRKIGRAAMFERYFADFTPHTKSRIRAYAANLRVAQSHSTIDSMLRRQSGTRILHIGHFRSNGDVIRARAKLSPLGHVIVEDVRISGRKFKRVSVRLVGRIEVSAAVASAHHNGYSKAHAIR